MVRKKYVGYFLFICLLYMEDGLGKTHVKLLSILFFLEIGFSSILI